MLVIVQIIKEGGQEDGECKVMVSDSGDQGFLRWNWPFSCEKQLLYVPTSEY